MLRTNFEKKIKIKSLVAWLISEERVDQKQIINFVQPNKMHCKICQNMVELKIHMTCHMLFDPS